MSVENIKRLLSHGEDYNIEFKQCRDSVSHSVYETVCSFLNHSGGTIILGANDDGTVEGVNANKAEDMKKNIVNTLKNTELFVPSPYITPEIHVVDGKTIIVLEVPSGQYVYSYKKRFYDRNFDSDQDITSSPDLLLTLFERKNPHLFEERIVDGASMADIDPESVNHCRNIVRVINPDHVWLQMSDEEVLKSCNLVQVTNEGIKLKYAAVLLFGTDGALSEYLPRYRFEALFHMCTWNQYQSHNVTISRYDDRLTLRTNLIKTYGSLMEFVERHMPDKFYLPEGTTQRRDLRYLIMREIVANMEVHTDFSTGYACFMEIFKDRVVTKNSTRLLPYIKEGEITVDELGNYTKNPLLVKVFGELGWVEDLGSGMRNILNYAPLYYKDYQIDIQNNYQFIFSITYADDDPGTTQTTPRQRPDNAQTTPSQHPENTPKDRREAILKYIEQHPYAGRKDIAQHIENATEYSVKYHLNKLQKEGIIKRIGPDFGGHWEIMK